MRKEVLLLCLVLFTLAANAQYWQQEVNYEIEVDFDDVNHQYTGKQNLIYFNNSPDTLNRLFFHMYNNAFKPGSLMSLKGIIESKPEKGIKSIKEYDEDEIGILRIDLLQQNSVDLEFEEEGTILIVNLDKPLAPGKKTSLTMEFFGQVPIVTRRSGRYGKEGVAYSMAQWYPKLCEYDASGWHADPYIGREFYGVWGDYDVKINIDSEFVLGGCGEVINSKVVRNGYGSYEGKPEGERVSWHFKAKNVHDFMWAADKEYVHKVVSIHDDLDFHLLYKNDTSYSGNWEEMVDYLPRMVQYCDRRFGKYEYSTFSIIQGGDRGMEYPTATLISGNRSLSSLLGVVIHEYLHSWYYFALGSNENAYPWMDEGFTSYADAILSLYLMSDDSINMPDFEWTKSRILALYKSDKDEVMSTHSNHYINNVSYGINAYNKGSFYLHQLAYVIGQEKLDEALRRYYNDWKYKHPGPEDFLLVAEKVSDIQLDWYNDNFIRSMNKIDYGIESIVSTLNSTKITLERIGDFIMPVDLLISLKNGEEHMYNIPLKIMWGSKSNQGYDAFYILDDWPFVQDQYSVELPFSVSEISSIAIDPEEMTLDVDRENNEVIFETSEDTELLFQQ